MTVAATLVRELAGEASTIVFDRSSARTFDGDGHLHVQSTNISKATVNPYWGREIPDFQRLGLDSNKKYMMLRDPAELHKAASTFDGKPLLFRHKPVSADDHAYDITVGSIDSPSFDGKFLKANLHVWVRDAISAIESHAQKQLSCGYRYTPDMTPGTYDGVAYDGVMRNIVGNHVALVREGRAGPDVVVGDERFEERLVMANPKPLSRKACLVHGALITALSPIIAADHQLDLNPLLADVTADNYKDKKASVFDGIKKASEGVLVKDATLDHVKLLLDKLDNIVPMSIDADPDPKARKEGESEEEWKKRLAAIGGSGGKDADPDPDKDKDKDKDKRSGAQDKNMVTLDQMNEAIKAAVTGAKQEAVKEASKIAKDIQTALQTVRPWVGDLAMTFDSADEVYRTALNNIGVKDIDKVHPSAYPAILAAYPKPGEKRHTTTNDEKYVTADAKVVDDFNKMFPGAKDIMVG